MRGTVSSSNRISRIVLSFFMGRIVLSFFMGQIVLSFFMGRIVLSFLPMERCLFFTIFYFHQKQFWGSTSMLHQYQE